MPKVSTRRRGVSSRQRQRWPPQPVALQLRFLQALTEVATEHNSTLIFPVPLDLLVPFLKKATDDRGE